VGSFKPRLLYPVKEPQHPVTRRLGGLNNQWVSIVGKKNLLPLQGYERSLLASYETHVDREFLNVRTGSIYTHIYIYKTLFFKLLIMTASKIYKSNRKQY